MIVYGSSLSPFVRKLMAYAHEKGIEVEQRQTAPLSEDEAFREASPFGKIPGFRDGDFTLSDSSAIIVYLEALKAEPVLVPAEPKLRARTIWYEEFSDTILTPVLGTMFFNRIVAPRFLGQPGDQQAADKAEREQTPPLLAYLERTIPARGYLV